MENKFKGMKRKHNFKASMQKIQNSDVPNDPPGKLRKVNFQPKNGNKTGKAKFNKHKKTNIDFNNEVKTEDNINDNSMNETNAIVPTAFSNKNKSKRGKQFGKTKIGPSAKTIKHESSESEEEMYVDSEFKSEMKGENLNQSDDIQILENSNKLKTEKPDKQNNKHQKAQKKNKKKSNKIEPNVMEERNSRTVFVGNVPTMVKKQNLQRFFNKFGKVQSVRLRGVTPTHPGISKRFAVIKKLIHPKRTSLHSYITFESREEALEALKMNGARYKGHHLRIQLCDEVRKTDSRKAIFIGNLPFDAEDDDLWTALESCGKIQSVRVIRNAETGMGIGIGYVNFESADSVELALQMENVRVKNKDVRIKRCHDKKNRKERENLGFKKASEKKDEKPRIKDEKKKSVSITIKKSAFQGTKFSNKKKKQRVNKGFLQKIKMSQKIAPKIEK